MVVISSFKAASMPPWAEIYAGDLNPTSHFQRHNRLNALAEALAAKRLPLHTATQDAVDLPKMVQVVCRFRADELLDRLPSAYLVDPIVLHPPCARDRLQQSQA
jgi:hypothetical protein